MMCLAPLKQSKLGVWTFLRGGEKSWSVINSWCWPLCSHWSHPSNYPLFLLFPNLESTGESSLSDSSAFTLMLQWWNLESLTLPNMERSLNHSFPAAGHRLGLGIWTLSWFFSHSLIPFCLLPHPLASFISFFQNSWFYSNTYTHTHL